MRALRKLLALLLSSGLLSQPALAQTRAAPVSAAASAGAVVLPQAPVLPGSLSLPQGALSAPLSSALPLPSAPKPLADQAPRAALALPAPAAVSARVAPISAAAPAAQPAEAQERPDFSLKVQELAAGVAKDAQAAAEEADGGRGAADRQFRRLTGEASREVAGEELVLAEGIDFSESQLQRVSGTSAALERAVAFAAGAVFQGALVQVRSRGSSARLTHSEENPDYDVMARLPQAWTPEQAAEAIEKSLPALKAALTQSVRCEAAAFFPGVEIKVSVEDLVALNDPSDGRRAVGVYMLPVHVSGPQGLLIDADVTFTGRPDYANDYPGYFDDQLASVRRLGGEAGVQRLLRDIRLAKRLFTTAIGSYKPWHGGPSGVGVEQLVMQSGRVSDADKGRTVLEAGSFDKLMDRVYAAAFDSEGRSRGFKKAKRAWTVHNAFMRPDSFLELMSEGAWDRLAQSARLYREARALGRPIPIKALRWEKPAPAPALRPAERRVPALETPAPKTLTLLMTSSLRLLKTQRLVVSALRDFEKAEGVRVERSRVSLRRLDGKNVYAIALQLPASADAAQASQRLRALLLAAEPGAAVEEAPGEPAFRIADAQLQLQPKPGPKAREQVERAAERLARALGLERPEVSRRPDEKGVFSVGFLLGDLGREKFAAEVVDYFKTRAGLLLAAIAYPTADAPAKRTGAEPGALTLEMLQRFTQRGPSPAERGDAYLYAQGAKLLPSGLEGAARAEARLEEDARASRTRTLFLRRNGRSYVMLDTFDQEGEPVTRPVKVPARLTQGLVSDTLVEVSYDEQGVRGLRPIGSYPADVIIGRVEPSPDGTPRLSPLFGHDAARALYGPLPIAGQAKAGELLQAFVRPAPGGYEAVPLMGLGTALTPEIAAREIALRHGARGYFEEGVLRQAEEIGRSQDPDADFRRMKASKGRAEDLRALSFVTIDPVGAGDLDDAYFARKEADGSTTWYLATADVAQYVRPGTPAFRAAARIGNTFYSVDKDGVPEYPMNHPVISKSVSSLLAGKDSLAMISKMRFSPEGKFLLEESEVFLGLVRVQGRYTYDQVAALWRGESGHGIEHLDQVALARELSAKLDAADGERGKLKLHLRQTEHRKNPAGAWATVVVEEDPLLAESHRLIEELKVYGNRAIAVRLEAIAEEAGIPHISRVHPAQEERVNERLRKELSGIGAPWPKNQTLWQYLASLHERADLREEVRETAQMLALLSRSSALYSADDAKGHEGLALEAKAYDHPSTPIRRFSDMYNRALLEAYLEGSDPRAVYEAALADLKGMGFADFEEYLLHLNGREQAARQMDREFDEFMSVLTLSRPENRGRPLSGYVKMVKEGKNASALIQLREFPATIVLRGEEARSFRLLDEVSVVVRGADLTRLEVDASVRKLEKR
ncbi:MAG TPA: hypothetical protein DCM05_12785 [Elusimicrobia bacterium]|nr:hypothetical protein [Elusimicrobiota bacterium]